MRNLLPLLVILLTLNSCGQSVLNLSDNKFTSEKYFPNSINYQWIYKVTDEINKTTDTVFVKIVADTVISNRPYMIWEYNYNDRKEKYYYSNNEDSITIMKFKGNNTFYKYDTTQLFIIPFEFEFQQQWEIPGRFPYNWFHNNRVIDIHEIVMIGPNKYNSVILIKTEGATNHKQYNEKIWFKPKLGIIRREIYITGWGVENITWELIDCNIE